jgi:flavodoxin
LKTLVIYDSAYGNTEKIAKAIGSGVGGDVQVLHAGKVSPAALTPGDFLFLGSPTQAGRATPVIADFIKIIPDSVLSKVNVAAFDTRISAKWVGIFGFAAGKIAESLKKKSAHLAAPPDAFFVSGKEGPLKDGELERAAVWGKTVIKNVASITK